MEITPIVKEDFVTIQDEEPVSQMIGKLKLLEKRSGLVFRKDKYLGLIEKKKLLKTKLDLTETKVKKYTQSSPIVSEHADIIETAYLMHQSNLDYLPVERNKSIIGVVEAVDLAALSLTLNETKKLKVDDFKIVKALKLNKDDPIAAAIEMMYKFHVEQVPIFDAGKLYGIISYRDLLRKYLNWSPRRDVSTKFNKMTSSRSAEVEMPHLVSLPIGSFSTNDNLVSVKKNDTLAKAVQLMVDKKISDVIVMDGEDIFGILTVKNILRQIGSLKVPKNFNLKFVGLNELKLEPYQTYNLKKICSNEAFKLQRKIDNEFSMTIHIKAYKKSGPNHKYSVNLNIQYPGQIITSAQEDWELDTALRKTFNNAKNKVKSKFRGDTTWDKYYE